MLARTFRRMKTRVMTTISMSDAALRRHPVLTSIVFYLTMHHIKSSLQCPVSRLDTDEQTSRPRVGARPSNKRRRSADLVMLQSQRRMLDGCGDL